MAEDFPLWAWTPKDDGFWRDDDLSPLSCRCPDQRRDLDYVQIEESKLWEPRWREVSAEWWPACYCDYSPYEQASPEASDSRGSCWIYWLPQSFCCQGYITDLTSWLWPAKPEIHGTAESRRCTPCHFDQRHEQINQNHPFCVPEIQGRSQTFPQTRTKAGQ